jgi:hypothetical protein
MILGVRSSPAGIGVMIDGYDTPRYFSRQTI